MDECWSFKGRSSVPGVNYGVVEARSQLTRVKCECNSSRIGWVGQTPDMHKAIGITKWSQLESNRNARAIYQNHTETSVVQPPSRSSQTYASRDLLWTFEMAIAKSCMNRLHMYEYAFVINIKKIKTSLNLSHCCYTHIRALHGRKITKHHGSHSHRTELPIAMAPRRGPVVSSAHRTT